MIGLFRRVLVFGVVMVAGAGCSDPKEDSASSTSSSTSSASTTTGTIDDPEAFCAQFQDEASCSFSDVAQEVFCGWAVVTPVSMENGACVLGEPVGSCHPLTGNSSDPGCGVPPGCESYPFHLNLDGQIGVFFQCGGAEPIGGEPCTYVSPGVFEPPECGCLCDEPIDSSSSGGATSSTSTTG